ncbi:MAG: hypothetical protein ACTHJS_13700 [Xanthobacteraceae bacterium]|jgi:hypothetical protein
MTKFLIGVATAALWFALSHAANAERICRQVCDNGTCVSRCMSRPDSGVIIHEREQSRHRDRGFNVDTPAGDVEIRR